MNNRVWISKNLANQVILVGFRPVMDRTHAMPSPKTTRREGAAATDAVTPPHQAETGSSGDLAKNLLRRRRAAVLTGQVPLRETVFGQPGTVAKHDRLIDERPHRLLDLGLVIIVSGEPAIRLYDPGAR